MLLLDRPGSMDPSSRLPWDRLSRTVPMSILKFAPLANSLLTLKHFPAGSQKPVWQPPLSSCFIIRIHDDKQQWQLLWQLSSSSFHARLFTCDTVSHKQEGSSLKPVGTCVQFHPHVRCTSPGQLACILDSSGACVWCSVSCQVDRHWPACSYVPAVNCISFAHHRQSHSCGISYVMYNGNSFYLQHEAWWVPHRY